MKLEPEVEKEIEEAARAWMEKWTGFAFGTAAGAACVRALSAQRIAGRADRDTEVLNKGRVFDALRAEVEAQYKLMLQFTRTEAKLRAEVESLKKELAEWQSASEARWQADREE